MDYFSEEQTYAILAEIGVDIMSETPTVWMCLCPFHDNTRSPAFAVNKENGSYICFNDACGVKNKDITNLVMHQTGKSMFAATRLIYRAKKGVSPDVSKMLQKNMSDDPMPTFPQGTLDGLRAAYWRSLDAQAYMTGRGFTEFTIDHFGIGYSPKTNMVTVPMHDVKGDPVGIIGRSISSKRFKNSDELPKKRTLWNLHRAKRNEHAILCEASFDAMRVWQATGIDAMATLGSSFSPEQAAYLNKYFTKVTIFTDDDWEHPTVIKGGRCQRCHKAGHADCVGHNTGFELGMKIAEASKGLSVTWAHLDSLKRYDGLKDAGDMTDEQIKYAVTHAISHAEMSRMAFA